MDDIDHAPMQKGRYSARTLKVPLTPDDVSALDPSYLVWAYETWEPKPCSKLLYDECVAEVAADRNQKRVSDEQDDGT